LLHAALKTKGVKAYTINPAQVDTSMTRCVDFPLRHTLLHWSAQPFAMILNGGCRLYVLTTALDDATVRPVLCAFLWTSWTRCSLPEIVHESGAHQISHCLDSTSGRVDVSVKFFPHMTLRNCLFDRDRPDQEMIPDLEITPEDIAEAALLPFRMSKNVVLEVRLHQTPEKSPLAPPFLAVLAQGSCVDGDGEDGVVSACV